MNTAILTISVSAALATFILSIASLQWEFEHDTPLLHYAGILIVKFGRVPYRDFFETSMPGTFAFHSMIIYLFGPGNLAFALVNLAFLALVLIVSWCFLASINRMVATAFVPWYGLVYLVGGPAAVLQRDGLSVLLIVGSMALVATRWPSGLLVRQLLCGLLFGTAATIKPQLSLGAPLVILTDLLLDAMARRREGRSLDTSLYILSLGASIIGYIVPISAALIWLATHDALRPFLAMATEYLPLHIGQTGGSVFLPPSERRWYLFRGTLSSGGYWPFIPFALLAPVAVWSTLRQNKEKVLIAMLPFLMMIIYGLCPVLAGQFWSYHYMPFVFFLVMTLSLLLLPLQDEATSPNLTTVTAFALLSSLLLASMGIFSKTLNHHLLEHNEAKDGRVARIVTATAAALQPGDSVQPIDWTDGVIHAMLRLELPIATPFFYDYHFHHNVDSPVIQKLRKRFIDAMINSRPTIIIEATQRPRVSGVGTRSDFPAFDHMMLEDYRIVYEAFDFRILRRKEVAN